MNKENREKFENEAGAADTEKNHRSAQDPDAEHSSGSANHQTEQAGSWGSGAEEDTDTLLIEQQKRIAELEKMVDELKDSNLRKAAELDNIRKRMQRERVHLFESAKVEAIEQFLPVNDDLQRTLQVMKDHEDDSVAGIRDGVEMIVRKFEEALKHYDVVRIDETGVPFNVDIHDAMMRRTADDKSIGSNIVLQVIENGYRMGERTIRHAKVIVSE